MSAFARGTNQLFVFADMPRVPRRRRRTNTQSGDRPGAAGKILLLGRIRELALYRTEYLQSKGFEVIAPGTRAEAIDAIRHSGFEAAILTYTLPNDLVLEYAQMVREYCPACPLLVITDKDLGDRTISPDAIVIADDGPEALLQTLRRLMQKKS